jgi:hypothetical protein
MVTTSLSPAEQVDVPRLTDSHGRVIHDLRVSITDRCNYKCVYCRTGEVGAQYPELEASTNTCASSSSSSAWALKKCASPAASPCCAVDCWI